MTTDQRAMISDSLSSFVANHTDFTRLRALRNKAPGYDKALLDSAVHLGWIRHVVPEEHGGSGGSFAEMALIVETLGTGLLGEPLAPVVMAARALVHSSNEALKAALLPKVCAGTLTPALAWTEDRHGPGDAACVLTEAGGGLRLRGKKRFVAGAGAAGTFLVTAKRKGEIALVLVEGDAPGVTLDYEWRADGTAFGSLSFHDVALETSRIVQAAGARAVVQRALDEGAVLASAELLGLMRGAYARTLDYMRNRVQYGRPIGSFQALQHRAVDLFIQQELTASVLADAVRAIDGGKSGPQLQKLAVRAKARASHAAMLVTQECVQFHGAQGIADENPIGLYLKRALVLSAWLGNARTQRRRFAELNRSATQSHGMLA